MRRRRKLLSRSRSRQRSVSATKLESDFDTDRGQATGNVDAPPATPSVSAYDESAIGNGSVINGAVIDGNAIYSDGSRKPPGALPSFSMSPQLSPQLLSPTAPRQARRSNHVIHSAYCTTSKDYFAPSQCCTALASYPSRHPDQFTAPHGPHGAHCGCGSCARSTTCTTTCQPLCRPRQFWSRSGIRFTRPSTKLTTAHGSSNSPT